MAAAAAPGPELVRHAVHPALAGLVAGIVAYREVTTGPVVRRQPAGSLLPLVLSLGPTLDVLDVAAGSGAGRHGSFVAGFMPGPATTSFDGEQHCVQIYVTPLGARQILACPGSELARQVVPADRVLPEAGASFVDRLASAPSWAARFDLVESMLLRRVGRSAMRPEPFVAWMWHEIQASRGVVRIGRLVDETGWSHRHATKRFVDQVGLHPKLAASIVRFEHASAALATRSAAGVAAAHGYADQSHLTREFLRFAGETPGAFRRAGRTTAHTAIG